MNLLPDPDLASHRGSKIPGSPSVSGYRLDRKDEPSDARPSQAQLSQSI